MNIISFVNITYLRIVLIGYFHCIVYELHITVHNNYFCIRVSFTIQLFVALKSLYKFEYRHMFDLLMDVELL